LVHINDFVLNGNGDPILALEQVYRGNEFDDSIPQAWIYADQSELFNWDSPEVYSPPFVLYQFNDDKVIFYTEDQFVVLYDGDVSTYNLPSEVGTIMQRPGIQRIGTNLLRVFTRKFGPYEIYSIDIVI